ncbi:MAG: TIGR02147 family protein [SAR324 cluster bacterium]|nr:TIGR02147 family protein [SAR324 cluster bacterium]MBF0351172.1 TIGR02147 family protein [SAR324 cluster bacterium]
MTLLPDLKINKDIPLDLYDFYDFREVLKEYFQQCAQQNKRYSYRYFSRRLELKSPGYIQSILKGERQMSAKFYEDVVGMMGLGSSELDYFDLLVRMDRARPGSHLYQEIIPKLRQFRAKTLKVKSIQQAQGECISSWLHWVVREMTLLKGASLNIQWFKKSLRQLFSVNSSQIAQCLEELKAARLLVEENFEITAPDPVIQIREKKLAPLLTQYHHDALTQAMAGLSLPAKQREYGSILVTTTPEKFMEFKKKLKQDRSEALKLLNVPPGEGTMLVSFSFQLFPIAQVDST